ncbi:MAG: hypothetical protein JO306_00200 [Gemmatimonadetes bacterium]|nr:hypothetical protein [Gemmatimonadota bacterium]
MNRRLALAVAATVLLAACGQSPTAAPTRAPSIRHDGGINTMGGVTGGNGTGNAIAAGSGGSPTDATSTEGGNGLGSGNATGGGNGLGSGN